MKRVRLRTLGLCLSIVCVGALVAFPGTASALDVPPNVVEDLGRAADHFHPPPLHLPHVELPPTVVKFGAADATAAGALEADQVAEDAAVSDEADALSPNEAEQDKIKECAEKGLLAILEEGGKGLTYEEAAEKGLTPCFDEFVPEGEQLRAVVDYFKKLEAERSSNAYAHSHEDPLVLGNWLRSTASSVHPAEPAPEVLTTTTTPNPPDREGGGLSSGGIVAIILGVAVLLFFGYRARSGKRRP